MPRSHDAMRSSVAEPPCPGLQYPRAQHTPPVPTSAPCGQRQAHCVRRLSPSPRPPARLPHAWTPHARPQVLTGTGPLPTQRCKKPGNKGVRTNAACSNIQSDSHHDLPTNPINALNLFRCMHRDRISQVRRSRINPHGNPPDLQSCRPSTLPRAKARQAMPSSGPASCQRATKHPACAMRSYPLRTMVNDTFAECGLSFPPPHAAHRPGPDQARIARRHVDRHVSHASVHIRVFKCWSVANSTNACRCESGQMLGQCDAPLLCARPAGTSSDGPAAEAQC